MRIQLISYFLIKIAGESFKKRKLKLENFIFFVLPQGPANLQDINYHEDQQLWNMEMECRERLEREVKRKEEDWMEKIRSREKEMREKIEKLEQDNMEIKEYAESLGKTIFLQVIKKMITLLL